MRNPRNLTRVTTGGENFKSYFTTKLIHSGVTHYSDNGKSILWKFFILRRYNVKGLGVECHKVCDSFSNGLTKLNADINRKRENEKSKPYRMLTTDDFR